MVGVICLWYVSVYMSLCLSLRLVFFVETDESVVNTELTQGLVFSH